MSFDERMRWTAYWALDSRRGKPVRHYYDQIRDSWRRGSSCEETEKKIRNLMEHAANTTEFYRDYRDAACLQDLPVVTKDTFRQNYEAMQSSLYKDAPDNRTMYTSGSTGTPLAMIQNKDKINHNTAAGIFLGAAGGYYIGMKQAFLRVWVHGCNKSRLSQLAENMIPVDSSRMDDAALAEIVELIRKKKVKSLLGYSSALEELSRYLDVHQVDTSDFQVSSIIPISETMADAYRARLQEQFSAPVRAWYSNEENGIMGLQEPDSNGYQIDTESYFYEILKMDSDEPAEEGELGRIVITDLYNYAFPILRYDTGDTAIGRREEKNGRFRFFLTVLYGRRSDIIFDTAGRPLTPYIITNNMWTVKGVRQFRFIQETEKDYVLWLNGDRELMDPGEICSRIAPYLGEDAAFRIEYVEEIPVLASGKRKYIENRCPLYQDRKGSR